MSADEIHKNICLVLSRRIELLVSKWLEKYKSIVEIATLHYCIIGMATHNRLGESQPEFQMQLLEWLSNISNRRIPFDIMRGFLSARDFSFFAFFL